MICGRRQEGSFATAVAQELVSVGLAPVVVEQRAETEVLDAVAAAIEELRDRSGFAELRIAQAAALTPFSSSAP